PGRVECHPQSTPHLITQMSLKRFEHVLAADRLSGKEGVVGGEELRRAVKIEAHLLYRTRKTKLGPESTPVRTKIDELCRVVLTGRRGDGEARSQNELRMPGGGKLLWGQSR